MFAVGSISNTKYGIAIGPAVVVTSNVTLLKVTDYLFGFLVFLIKVLFSHELLHSVANAQLTLSKSNEIYNRTENEIDTIVTSDTFKTRTIPFEWKLVFF